MEALDYPSWMAYLPKILLALVIFIMDEVYHRIATFLNNLGELRIFYDALSLIGSINYVKRLFLS